VVLLSRLAHCRRGDLATIAVTSACALLIGACGGSTQLPSTPTPVQQPTPAVTAAPVARLGVTIDSFGSQFAINALTEVTFDASGSSGTDLQFGLDFGDGQGADKATATHIYTSGPKTYKARAIVTDSLGRTDSVAMDVAVRNFEGDWVNSIFNPANKRYETRYLFITSQPARAIKGAYRHPEGNDTVFTGELTGPRGASFSLVDRTIEFTSGADGGFDTTAIKLTVHVRGGSADGQTLTFTRFWPY